MFSHRFSVSACALFFVVLCPLVVFSLGSCGKDDPGPGSFNPLGGKVVVPPLPPILPPDSSLVTIRLVAWDDLTGGGTTDNIPAGVDEIRFEISSPDITTQTRTISPGSDIVEEDFTISTGVARRITVLSYDAADSLLYSGTKYTDIADSALTTAVGMVSAADVTAPVHAGIDSVMAVSDNHVLISWSMATDGPDLDYTAVYLIYMSTVSGSFDYSSPSFTSSPGETSFLITNLNSGTAYFFVVRAMDRAGNINLNTNQQSITTPSAGGALYVDIESGVNNSSCGTSSSPCRTITYGLSKATANQTIHVAKGTYTEAKGEVFPLQLKPGTSLDGEGYWWMGVKVIKETFIEGPTPLILGADSAQIIACYLRPTAWGTSAPAIADDGHSLTVFHCTIDGAQAPSGVFAAHFSGSSTLSDSRIENFDKHSSGAVRIWGAGGSLINDNVVVDCAVGISVTASNTLISNNSMKDIGSIAISTGSRDYLTDDVLIFRNNIENTVGSGISLCNVTDAVITHNTISYPGGYGISVWNYQKPLNTVEVLANFVIHGSSSALYLIGGQASINYNSFACDNVAGAFVRSSQVIDLSRNEWENDPPVIDTGRGPYDPGCDLPWDICYESQYALTPAPQYLPTRQKGPCLFAVCAQP